MVAVLFLAVVVLGVLLFDTRGRLKRLEQRMADMGPARSDGSGVPKVSSRTMAAASQRRPAIIVDDVMPPLRTDKSAEDQGVGPGLAQPVTASPPPEGPIAESSAAEPFAVPNANDAIPETDAAPLSGIVANPPSTHSMPAPAASLPKEARGAGQRFEDLFGRQLPIWAGGITLAVAGVLLVKYSIDSGLLSPMVRVLIGLLFGAGLIGGAEAALRHDERVRDPRVRQALSGAGIATLYTAILAAANLYGLVGPATAFVGLALVTALAMALSIRFGAPSAILGLVGGLAAPALAGEGPPNVPLLSAYLALTIGGLTTLSRRQKWMWLGVGALVGGAGWGGILILTGVLDFATSLSLGLLMLVLGIALPWIAFAGARATLFRMVAAVVAAAQIALLVARGGFEPLVWGFYLLLAGAMVWLAWREERFRPLPPVGLTIGLLLAALWPQPPVGQFMTVLLALAAIHAGPALLRLWRVGGSMIEAGQVIGVALAGYAMTLFHYHQADGGRDGVLALLAVLAAMLPASAAWLGWARERQGDARFALLVLASALLLSVAAIIGLPQWGLPVAVAAVTAGLILLARAAGDKRIEHGATVFLMGSVLALLFTDPSYDEWARLAGEAGAAPMLPALLRWGAVALAAGLGAVRLTVGSRQAVAVVAAALAYGMVAQVAPLWSLPLLASAGVIAMLLAGRRFVDVPARAALGAFAAIALLWAVEPFARWAGPALLSVFGEPMLAAGLPSALDAVTRLAIPVGTGLFVLWRGDGVVGLYRRRAVIAILALIGVAAVHGIYKQMFQLEQWPDVVRQGLAERIVWEWLLLGVGCAVWRWRGLPLVALAGAGAAVAHGIWYGLLLFNPLTSQVAVGPWPVVNLLLPAFTLLFAGLWVIERCAPRWRAAVEHGVVVARMILIPLFAYASLRQLFCGGILVGTPVGGVESIGVSVLAIALAVGFLLWGIRSGRHDWRIGSLILMLAAVAKVFLMDAAGLEGLLRIASFLALGFSLIGIGWLYSRFLRSGGAEGAWSALR